MHLLKKIENLNHGVKIEKQPNNHTNKQNGHFVERPVLNLLGFKSFGVFQLCFTSGLYFLEAFEHLPFFTQNGEE